MEAQLSNKWKKMFLVLNCLILAVGNCGGPLVLRLYFIKGGKRIWFSSWLQMGGFPIILIPLFISYFSRRKADGPTTKLILMKYRVFMATTVIGILTGLDNYLYSSGVARIPVSTSALLVAPQLAFTALFAFLLVKQKFTAYSINAVILLTVAAGVLALDGSGDKPRGESNKAYVLGFIMTLAGASLGGLIFPMVEMMYLRGKQQITYTLVLEIQLVMCFFATVFCTVGMFVNNDFQAIRREAREFELGETKYYTVVVCSAIIFQCFFLGVIGVIFCASSLFSGIMVAVLLPVTEILAVLCFHERFQAPKVVSLALLFGDLFPIFMERLDKALKQRWKAMKVKLKKPNCSLMLLRRILFSVGLTFLVWAS